MKKSWLVPGLVLVAIAILVTWIARNTYWADITVPNLPRGEAATNPFYTAQRLAEELGAETEWRKSWSEAPAQDAVLFLRDWNWDLISTRRRALERWVEAGGRLVVDRTLSSGGDSFSRWSGLEFENPHLELGVEEDSDDTPIEERRLEPMEPCRDLTVREGQSQLSRDRDTYAACGLDVFGYLSSVATPAWALEDDAGLQVVRVRIGRGSVTLVNGESFTNRQLLMLDNPALFVDAFQLKRGDDVVFASEQERASLLQLIWMYGAPAVMLGLAWIAAALWRGSVRFGPLEATPDSARRSLAEMIRGTGQFAWRIGRGKSLHGSMVRALREAARQRIFGYDSLQQEDKIAAIARIAQIDAEALTHSMNVDVHRRAQDFKNAIALLNTARLRVLHHERRQMTGSSAP